MRDRRGVKSRMILNPQYDDRSSLPHTFDPLSNKVCGLALRQRHQDSRVLQLLKRTSDRFGVFRRAHNPADMFLTKESQPSFRGVKFFWVYPPTAVWIAIQEGHVQVVDMREENECLFRTLLSGERPVHELNSLMVRSASPQVFFPASLPK